MRDDDYNCLGNVARDITSRLVSRSTRAGISTFCWKRNLLTGQLEFPCEVKKMRSIQAQQVKQGRLREELHTCRQLQLLTVGKRTRFESSQQARWIRVKDERPRS